MTFPATNTNQVGHRKIEELDFIDIVSSSHNHTDHLDGETLIPLIQVNPNIKLIIPEANREFVSNRIKCDPDYPIGLNDGEEADNGTDPNDPCSLDIGSQTVDPTMTWNDLDCDNDNHLTITYSIFSRLLFEIMYL